MYILNFFLDISSIVLSVASLIGECWFVCGILFSFFFYVAYVFSHQVICIWGNTGSILPQQTYIVTEDFQYFALKSDINISNTQWKQCTTLDVVAPSKASTALLL